MPRFPKLSFLSLSLVLASSQVQAEFHPSLFPFMPRVLGEGFFGDETLGEVDAMVPLFGNHGGIFYIDGMGKTGNDDGYLGSFGGGYRGIHNDRFLWGAYVFGDFNRVARGPHFPVVNPGLELMTNYWDIHVNGYFPTSPKQKVEGRFLGEQLGTTQYISFAGHNQFDNLINLVEEVGNGVDGEVGLTLPFIRNLRVYTGGYHFSFKEARDINGIIGGVEMPLNNYFTVSLRNSYDRVQKNTAQLGIRLTLGAMEKTEQPKVEDRLLDPIRRHLGTWNTGSGIPSQQTYVNTGVRVLTRDNIWFFSSAGTPFIATNGFSNCTYENNCLDTSFSQTTVDAIDAISPAANLYLGPGNYGTFSGTSFSSSAVVQQANFLTTLSLNQRQALYGRNGDFTLAQLRTISGSFTLSGGNTYDSLSLQNSNSEFTDGIRITGGDVTISNSVIGTNSNTLGFRNAVIMSAAENSSISNVTIENSRLEAFVDNTNDVNVTASGVIILGGSNVQLVNNIINVNAIQRTANAVTGRGIVISRGQEKELNNVQVDVNVRNLTGGDANAQGIVQSMSSDFPVNIRNSTLNANVISTGNGVNSTATATGITVNGGRPVIINSTLTVNSLNETINGVSLSTGVNAIAAFVPFTGMNITSIATSANAATSKALMANSSAINDVPSNGTFLTSTFTAQATGRQIAVAKGMELNTSSFNGLEFNANAVPPVADSRRLRSRINYNVTATGNNANAIGVEAIEGSRAVLFNPTLDVTANNAPGTDFLSSQNSEIRICSLLGLSLTGTCPVVGK